MTLRDRQILSEDSPPPPPAERALRDRTPYVSYAVIGMSVLMFLLGDRLIGPTVLQAPGSRPVGLQPWTLYGPLVRAGQWGRVVGYLFEHGGPIHIFFNMSAVWSLGTVLERLIGNWRFLVISAITALGASAMVLYVNFGVPTVGASGMILGWAGAFLPILPRESRRSLLVQLLPVAVISALPGVSWAGHLGGFVMGIGCGFALRQGPKRFALLAPVLLFLAAAATVVATFHA